MLPCWLLATPVVIGAAKDRLEVGGSLTWQLPRGLDSLSQGSTRSTPAPPPRFAPDAHQRSPRNHVQQVEFPKKGRKKKEGKKRPRIDIKQLL